MSMKIYLVGGVGFALEVVETFAEAHPGLELAGVFDDDTRMARENSTGAPYLGTVNDFVAETPPDSLYLLGFGDNDVRMELDRRFGAESKRPFAVIHPAASVSPRAEIGEGAYVAAFAFVGPRCKIGRQVIVNVGASIGHNAVLGEFAQVCPGARVSSFARIGRGAFLASNAVVPPNGIVEDGGRVAANSFAARRVPEGRLVAGVPAKEV